ncbi:hypothetical protein C0989_003334 [Termitomyces sp. Mn162]|nr:hypothetical protein C0989_003334 [Termitomyces sp. Mn162]
MSSPSYSAASPTPLISDVDVVIVYDKLSTVVVGSLGGPRWAKFCPTVPQSAVGDAEEVPPLQRIPQAEVTVEEFARALAWAQGPPMLEWCQNEAPCVLCARQGKACIFDAPSMDAALGWASSSPEPPPSITEVFLCKQVEVLMAALMAWKGELRQARENQDVVRVKKEVLGWAQNTLVQVALERVLEVRGLQEHLMQQEAWSMEEVEEWEMAPEGGLLWAELEVARQREDWLANEAASGRAGILDKCWVQEHQVLLDSASAAFALIQDGLAQMPVGQPPELQQEMARVGRLLVGHQWHNAVAPELWWKVAADMGQALPGLVEVLAVVWAQMEIDLWVGMAGVLGEE